VAVEAETELETEINPTPPLRFKVMLYEDAESEVITPEEVMDLMEQDTKAADLILWVGISFQQSASTAYFRKVRHWLQEAGKSEHVVQAVINPSDEALWNLMTALSNQNELNVVEVLASSDEVLPGLARHVTQAAAAAEAAKIVVEEEETRDTVPTTTTTNGGGILTIFKDLDGAAGVAEVVEEEEVLPAATTAIVHDANIDGSNGRAGDNG
jgi:hypothetical protein